ncbi:LysM domain-containing protein [Streptomyces longisporoflavus]|uniref:LysM domain-containing protein n=1 Tax=Streptomyces longisporoflavus TaxID=28044 RepID=A0ABW7QI17_9ACTN
MDPSSRYARQPLLSVTLPDGTVRTMSAPRTVPVPPPGGQRVTAPGDRLDLMAAELTGDSTQWWRVADANPFGDATRLETPGIAVDLPGG